jgi:hypothetical protein
VVSCIAIYRGWSAEALQPPLSGDYGLMYILPVFCRPMLLGSALTILEVEAVFDFTAILISLWLYHEM